MKLQNSSELGPWGRYDDQQQRNTPEQANKNQNIKQQLLFPRVIPLKQYEIKSRKIKDKQFKSIQLKPIHIEISKQQINSSRDYMYNAKISQTISFQAPKISFYNKNISKSINKPKDIQMLFNLANQRQVKQQIDKKIAKREISKVDLMINSENNEVQNQKIGSKQIRLKQYQFTKKRSLMQLLKYLKMSSNQGRLTQRASQNQNKHNNLTRFDLYRNYMSISLETQSRYIPYFQSKKSSIPSKKK